MAFAWGSCGVAAMDSGAAGTRRSVLYVERAAFAVPVPQCCRDADFRLPVQFMGSRFAAGFAALRCSFLQAWANVGMETTPRGRAYGVTYWLSVRCVREVLAP